MMKNISILDCTLRDGGYINNWEFQDKHILKILNSLEKSKIDIIECGYLSIKSQKQNNTTLFGDIKVIDNLIQNLDPKIKKVAMINFGDFEPNILPNKSKTCIDGIRLAFHKEDLNNALKQAQVIKSKGYKLFFQPMVTKRYNNIEFLEMLNEVNKLKPYAFYIVDSFGSMTLKEFQKYILLSDDYLINTIALGYHSHNNMQLAFSNAINLSSQNLKREIILDSSIYGIGRGAGNLNTELILDFLNKEFDTTYNITPLLEIIDSLLENFMNKNAWGFSPAQYLSASLEIHPNYANYLINKNNNHISTIQKILLQIPKHKKISFDKAFIEELYIKTITNNTKEIKEDFCRNLENKNIFIIASGASILTHQNIVKEKINNKDYISIAINHKPDFKCDFYFFANQKRYDEFSSILDLSQVILTNNIHYPKNSLKPFILNSQDIINLNGKLITNATIILLNYLAKNNIKEVEIAGLDGYQFGIQNYSYEEYDTQFTHKTMQEQNCLIQEALAIFEDKIKINFITPSIFNKGETNEN